MLIVHVMLNIYFETILTTSKGYKQIIFFLYYRQSIIETIEVKKQLAQLLEQDFIQPGTSPCVSPIIMVPKKEKSCKTCIDFHALHKITIKNMYHLSWIDDLSDQLQQAKFFTKMDLKLGYHQVKIKAGDMWKKTFKMKQGFYEWLLIPFGLSNAPATL